MVLMSVPMILFASRSRLRSHALTGSRPVVVRKKRTGSGLSLFIIPKCTNYGTFVKYKENVKRRSKQIGESSAHGT